MTQLDLPQISVQRYVELLKRRRWQVVPASLLGLLLGGVIAFFIPRYFVARTMLDHQMAPGATPSRNQEDPFRSIVEDAKSTIPLAVLETITKLGWPEAQVADPFVRGENEREIRSRLDINDSNQSKDRDYAQISVAYRDLDGERAATFLNMLVEVWIKQRLERLRQQAEREQDYATEEFNRANRVHEKLAAECRFLETEYGIDPLRDPQRQREQRDSEQKSRAVQLSERKAALAGVQSKLTEVRNTLAVTDEEQPVPVGTVRGGADMDPLVRSLITFKTQQLLKARQALGNFHPHTTEHANSKRLIEQLEQELAALGVGAGAEATTQPNPAFAELRATERTLEGENQRLAAEIAVLTGEIAAEAVRLQRLAVGHELYVRQRANLDDALQKRQQASLAKANADSIFGRLQNQQTVRQIGKVLPPPRPTEPNILIVALIGCVLGLGFATGLILLLDVMQGSFKTLEEVERGLAVPVLGGISYLETEVQRERLQRGRRRASLFAVVFLCLCVVVVTVYYIDPTRLPPVVRDVLTLMLGK